MGVVDAGQQIKSRVGSLDRVEADTASENVAEIKVLRRIIEEVATHESKHARSDVAVVTDSTAVRVRRGLRGNG